MWGDTPCPSRITLSIPTLKTGSLPRVPINVTTQSDLGLWLDLGFQGWMLQDHRTSLNPCSRGHSCRLGGRARVGGQRGRRTSRKQWNLGALSQGTEQGSSVRLSPGLQRGHQRPTICLVSGKSSLTPGYGASLLLPFAKVSSR